MSRRRNRHKSVSSVLAELDESTFDKQKFGVTTTASLYIPDSKNKSKSIDVDLTNFKRQRVFNKNISFFRQNFNQNDVSLLPFMSSLRARPNHSFQFLNKTTQQKPFLTSLKSTINQKTKKKICDIQGKQRRVSTAYYRWHNKTGRGTVQSVQFQCTLRDYNTVSFSKNPEEQGFKNLIKPIIYPKAEAKVFHEQELICQRQKKLFRFSKTTNN